MRGYIILALIILIIVSLSFVPIKFVAEYESGYLLYLKFLFFKFKLYPKKEKKKKKKKTKEEIKAEEEQEKKDILYYLSRLSAIREYIFDTTEFIARRCIIVEDIKLKLDYGTGDAPTTGVANGVLNGLVYGLLGIIHNHTLLQKQEIEINPDFFNLKLKVYYFCIVKMRLVHIISIEYKALKLYLAYRKTK